MDDLVALSELIVDDLFINGNAERAERLILMSADGRDLGGWGRRPMADRINKMLNAVLNHPAIMNQTKP